MVYNQSNIMVEKNSSQEGFTLIELMIAIVVLGLLTLGTLTLLAGLFFSAGYIKKQAVAMTLATDQMEYLKSLPYDSLAVAGGDIVNSNPLPASFTKTVNGITYTITTAIAYVDDAYDGCTSYPNQTLLQTYCRNYPPPSGAPAEDLNPMDYKDLNVRVYDKNNALIAQVDTDVSARVAETSSTTGALFVKVIDGNGNPVSGVTVQITNSTFSPTINLSDSTDTNGISIFYGLPPDTSGYDYNITASMSGYSTLTTIVPSGSLQPNYSNQNVFTQLSSFVTLTIKPTGQNSLVIETTDTSGSPLASVKVYVKGGYKKYTSAADTNYYYDNYTPTDNRPTTDSGGQTSLTNLVPGPYIFCGDNGSTNCKIGSTTYYLAAAVPYGGVNPFNPVNVPTYSASNPPSTTYAYGGIGYYQKVRLMLTTNSNFPRVYNLNPYDASQASGTLNSFGFSITGVNLPCTSNGSGCGTTVKFLQGSSTYTAACTGSSAGTTLNCTVNLSAASQGNTQLQISSGGNTLTLPNGGQLGGIIVTP